MAAFMLVVLYAWSIDSAYRESNPGFLQSQTQKHRNYKKNKQEKLQNDFQK